MVEFAAMRIKNSFSFNKPVITEQNCQQYFKEELLNYLKSIVNNRECIKISETFKLSAKKYCSLSAEGLDVLLARQYTWNGLQEINKANLQKFGYCLSNCIKKIKNSDNSDKLDNMRLQMGKSIISTIDLRFLMKNEDDKNFLYVRDCRNKIDDIEKEDQINAEIMKCFNKFITISYVDELAKENKIKAVELTLVEMMTETVEETLELCSEEVEKKREIKQDISITLEKVTKQPQKQVEIRKQSASQRESTPSVWQKLSPKKTQFFATSWNFIKNKIN